MATAPTNDPYDPVVAGEIVIVDPAMVAIGPRLRPIDPVWADAMGRAIERDGQITPIDIAPDPSTGGWILAGAGGHRLTGAQRREHNGIEARIISTNRDVQRRREAAENLFRRDNDPVERAAAIAELVRIHKVRAGIDPVKDGRAASAGARWQKQITDEADDATATIAVAYGWSEEVGEQLGLSSRTVRNDLLIYRRIAPSLVARLRDARPLLAKNATQLRALAKLEPEEQQKVVWTLENSPTPKSIGDAIAKVRGSNRAIDPEAKRLSAFIGAFGRMGLAEKKGALEQLRGMLPAGFTLVVGESDLRSIVALIKDQMAEELDAAWIVQQLVENEGARARYTNGTYELRLQRVVATCTAGDHGLLGAWIKAAERRLAAGGAA